MHADLVSIAPSTGTVTLYSTTLCTLPSGSRTTRNTRTLPLPYHVVASTPGRVAPLPDSSIRMITPLKKKILWGNDGERNGSELLRRIPFCALLVVGL